MVRAAVDIRRRQPAIDVTLAIGVFGRQRAGGAGPDEHGNAIGAMARDRIGNRATKTVLRSEEHTSEIQSLMRISYAVFCLKKKRTPHTNKTPLTTAHNLKHT